MDRRYTDEYATKDLYLASFLRTKGIVIKKLEQHGEAGPVYFVFENKDECERLENVFWNGIGNDILVNAKSYFTNIRDLKSRIFSMRRITKKAVIDKA